MAALWPVIEGSMDELMKSYPAGLKEAFNIASLDSVEAYVDAEMLSLIVPLAIAFLAVRIAAGAIVGRRGARLPRHAARRAAWRAATLVAGAFIVAAVVVAEVLAVITALTWIAGCDRGRGSLARRARPRLRERVAAGDAVRRARAARRRRAAPRGRRSPPSPSARSGRCT